MGESSLSEHLKEQTQLFSAGDFFYCSSIKHVDFSSSIIKTIFVAIISSPYLLFFILALLSIIFPFARIKYLNDLWETYFTSLRHLAR